MASVGLVSKRLFIVFAVIAAIGAGYAGAKLYGHIQEIPDVTMVERFEPIEAIQIFDRQDKMICTVEGDEDRRVVPLNQISTPMQQAMLAAEDHHFYEHNGINFFSIIRATFANMQAGHVVEGGSTITQQLAKNLFFKDAGRNFDRKIREAYVAYELERRYTKERILNMYLNQVYFGNNAYGIERAASRYFDKTAAALSIAESAFIAGLVKAPSELGTVQNRAAATERQREIIDKMVEYGYITEKQATAAKAQKLAFKKGTNPLQKYPYYISYVLQVLHERFSQAEMRTQGLKVYTNLDPLAQELAEKTLNEGIKHAPKGVTQGALVTIGVHDGDVMAMVGGVGNFWKNQFNRATNPHTVGSSFKPFVYLTAFTKGVLTPDSIIDDSPLTVKSPWGQASYSPQNFDHKFYGKIQVRRALALSRNIPSVKICQMVGPDSVIETARLAGVTAKLDSNLSLALGSSAASPLEMAGAYSTFARAGVVIKPQVLRKIENNRGQVIEVFEPKQDRPFQLEPIARLVDCMQNVVQWGTGTQAKLADRPVAGKTGTADEGKDIWFIGFTPDMVTAVWGGNDENKPIAGHNVTGGVVMAKIWHDYNDAFYKARPTPPGSFMVPSPISPDELNAKKGDSVAKSDLPGPGEALNAAANAGNNAASEAPKTEGDIVLKPMEAKTDDSKPSSGAVLAPSSSGAPTPGSGGSGNAGSGNTGAFNNGGSGAQLSPAAAAAPSTTLSNTAPPIAPQGAAEQARAPEIAPTKALSPWSSAPMESKNTKELIASPKRLYPYNAPTIWMPAKASGDK
jgi:penicillin-binding protein 1A